MTRGYYADFAPPDHWQNIQVAFCETCLEAQAQEDVEYHYQNRER